MGTWDTGSFDNDTALDWIIDLEHATDLAFIEATLDEVLAFAASEPVDADSAERAVAAADTVARLRGWSPEETPYTEGVAAWVRAHRVDPSPELTAKARQALSRLTTAPSELLDLWNEAADPGEWREAISDLLGRLGE